MYDNVGADVSVYFDNCIAFIRDAQHHGSVLVHCAQGVSRSASVVIAYLIRERGMTFSEALSHSQKVRPVVKPNDAFVRQLRAYERKHGGKSGAGGAPRGVAGPALPPALRARGGSGDGGGSADGGGAGRAEVRPPAAGSAVGLVAPCARCEECESAAAVVRCDACCVSYCRACCDTVHEEGGMAHDDAMTAVVATVGPSPSPALPSSTVVGPTCAPAPAAAPGGPEPATAPATAPGGPEPSTAPATAPAAAPEPTCVPSPASGALCVTERVSGSGSGDDHFDATEPRVKRVRIDT